MKLRFCSLVLACFSCFLAATEYDPWFGRSLELDLRLIETFQHYSKLNIEGKNKAYHGTNYLGDFSFSLPYDRWNGEFECLTVVTKQRRFCVDSFKFTGRYLWLDEAIADPLNIAVGYSLGQAFGKATQDLALYHASKFETELHIAAGKEFEGCWNWTSRVWGLFGAGQAYSGAPWIFSEAAWEQRSGSGQFFRAFAYYRHGCGEHHHHLITPWQLNYRYLDLGARYTHLFDNYCELSIEYAYRCCVKNGLADMNIFILRFLYPFGF